MCGFTFVLDKSQQLTEEVMNRQIEILNHRGPDYGSALIKKMDQFDLGLVHNRLSIIDLSERANQPMETDMSILVFNGEIYNYKELTEIYDLKISSKSDTEVLIKGLEIYGEEFIAKLNGMFAFCYYNKFTDEILVARDRLGVKPLYSYKDEEKVVFSSEIKGILPFVSQERMELNANEVLNYFRDGCTSGYGTLYKNIGKIPPGHFCKFSHQNLDSIEATKYWEYEKSDKGSVKSFNELTKKVEDILHDSIRLRLRSDVPVGIYLSGGYDSSLIASLVSDIDSTIHTYSIGLKNQQYDESKYAARIAKKVGINHTTFTIDENNLDAEMLSKLMAAIDDPIADPSIIPNFHLNRMACGHIKVALTGDGGDELFAGYNSYLKTMKIWGFSNTRFAKSVRLITRARPFRVNRKLSRLRSFLGHTDILDLHKEITSVFNSDYLVDVVFSKRFTESLTTKNYKSGDVMFKSKLHGLLSHDIENDLPNKLLLKTDRTSMAYGVEARDPLLDYRLFDLASKTRHELFYDGNSGKYPIKFLANKRIGKNLLDRPKSGFNIPIKEICQGLFKNNQWIFNSDLIENQGIFSQKYIDYLKKNLGSDRLNYRHLYSFLIFQLWYYEWLEK